MKNTITITPQTNNQPRKPTNKTMSSGFASLLSQFKETTTPRKRSSSQPLPPQKQSKIQPSDDEYCYPSSTPVKNIYIACPANTETGGPEALHQLCHMINTGKYFYDDGTDDTKIVAVDEFLITNNCNKNKNSSNNNNSNEVVVEENRQQIKAFMLYLRERSSFTSQHPQCSVEQVFGDRSPRPSKYNKYNAPMVEHRFPQSVTTSSSLDSQQVGGYSSDLVVWPECWTHLIDSLQPQQLKQKQQSSKKYQIAIWWLSVNNNKERFTQHHFTIRKDVLHLVQSAYAREYVRSKLGGSNGSSCCVLTMTEFIPYTSSEFELTSSENGSSGDSKSNLVVYNPAKGMTHTDEIIRRACGKQAKTESDGSVTGSGGIRFCPIGKGLGGRQRMTGEEVVGLLKKAKVYIDFGPHPGMDRLPREAALAGCVVITNREGAANFEEDLPLPYAYKFDQFDVEKIYSLIKECCTKHDEYANKMDTYKSWILGQRAQMKACVDEIVNEIVTKRIGR